MSFVKKILGLALLLGGLTIILYSLYSSYNIFTAKAGAPEIFKTEVASSSKSGGQSLEAQLQQMIGEQLKGLMPANSIPQLLNLISWSIFAGLLFVGGGQIAGLGIKLLR